MKFLLAATMAAAANAADWAVLVAGSSGYGNYRHQADVCHAYQVVKKFGIPDERVIVMMADDVANSPENPFKGQLFNKPADGQGVDVYADCKIDYKGRDVTPENFISVITGDSSASGPVLQSTSSDRVFINFVDHGGPGIIAFPEGELSSDKLNDALNQMHSSNMYDKLVFYMEACESGSMFENIIDPSINIYVTTAANADESSWGTYCPPDDKVNGQEMNSCLGDLYSVNWMENADAAGKKITLEKQFNIVKTKTDKSHVMQYGDQDFTSDPIGDYMGDDGKDGQGKLGRESRPASSVRSPDIPLHLAYYKYLRADRHDVEGRMALGLALQKELSMRMETDALFSQLAKSAQASLNSNVDFFTATPTTPVLCGACCDIIRAQITTSCGGYDDYSLQFHRVVVNICAAAGNDATFANKVASEVAGLCKPSQQL